jgi:hypothetical protein
MMSSMARVAAYVPDLMDRSRLGGIPDVEFVTGPGALVASGAAILVVDLSRPGVLDVLPGLAGRRVIAFGSHVDTDLLDAARAAGCDEVMARSEFFRRAPELLGP